MTERINEIKLYSIRVIQAQWIVNLIQRESVKSVGEEVTASSENSFAKKFR